MVRSYFESAGGRARRRWRTTVALLGLLAGCVLPHPGRITAGMAESEVVALMGEPTARYPMPAGATRLEFARGPAGRETWMVDIDAVGHVAAIDQVLDLAHFRALTSGTLREQLLRSLGTPGRIQKEYLGRETWFWRYPTNDCLIAAATLSPQGALMGGVSMMPDPGCERPVR